MTKKLALALACLLSLALLAGCTNQDKSKSMDAAESMVPSMPETTSMAKVTPAMSDAMSMANDAMSMEKDTMSNVTMTAEELAKYNGKDGQPAYVAVDGVIYDVSNVPQWKDGEHQGMHAGKDITKDIENVSPHGLKVLTDLPSVGHLV